MVLQNSIRKEHVSSQTKGKLTTPLVAHNLLAGLVSLSISLVMRAAKKLEYTLMIIRNKKKIYTFDKMK